MPVSLAAYRNTQIRNLRTALADNRCRIGSCGKLLLETVHLLDNSVAVSSACLDLIIDEFDVTRLYILAESRLQLVILGLEVFICNLDVCVFYRTVSQRSKLDLTFFIVVLESHLGFCLVGKYTAGKQRLILLAEKLCPEILLDKQPVVVNRLHLVELGRLLGLRLVVAVQELLERIHVKTARLLIDKRCLRQHRIGTIVQYILYFLLCHRQPYLLCISLQDTVADQLLPYLVLHLVEFFLGKVVTLHGKFDR